MLFHEKVACSQEHDSLPTEQAWHDLIETEKAHRELPISPLWIDEKWTERTAKTFSRPVRVSCANKRRIYLKPTPRLSANSSQEAAFRARSSVNEQIAGRIGRLMNAPIPEVTLVTITSRVRCVKKENMPPLGVHHGSWEITNLNRVVKVNEARLWRTTAPKMNRPRFAQLGILYGWLWCTYDHQFAFETGGDQRVWSMDHGYTLGLGRDHGMCHPDWDTQMLRSRGTAAVDTVIQREMQLSEKELAAAVVPLAAITFADIANVVAAVPDDWYISDLERVTLADYLERRRRDLIAKYLGKGER